MKPIKYCIVLFIFLSFGQLCAQMQNQVRMAYYNPGQNAIPPAFYERARANGFNYVLVEFRLESSTWTNGKYTGGPNIGLRKQLRDEFLAADSYGLKLIPAFQTSNTWADHWAATQNKKIQWQKLPSGIFPEKPERVVNAVTAFAPDMPNDSGFEYSYNQLLDVIYWALDSAHLRNPKFSYDNLDYIHFGADEPAALCTLGHGGATKSIILAGLCQKDSLWLKNNANNLSPQNQIIALLSSNIKRNVLLIKAAGRKHAWYSNPNKTHNTTALYYGDALDPNHNGGAMANIYTFSNIFNPLLKDTTKILTYGLASHDSVKAVKDSSIVVQWVYDSHYLGQDYNTDNTFRYFKTNGLKFLHGNALAWKEDTAVNSTALHQMMEQAAVGSNPIFNGYLRGFVSFHWHSIPYVSSKPMYKTMDFLSQILWYNAALFE